MYIRKAILRPLLYVKWDRRGEALNTQTKLIILKISSLNQNWPPYQFIQDQSKF